MKKDNKNVIIGGLLAIVFVMAVGFAAFSTTLNINGSANITSKWDVHFVTGTSAGANYTATSGFTGGSDPAAKLSVTATTATLSADFEQPGDSITYTLTIQNGGNLNAKLATPSITGTGCTVSGNVCTSADGNIKFTVNNPSTTALNAGATTTMTVTAEYVNKTANTNANGATASIKVTLNATQATA